MRYMLEKKMDLRIANAPPGKDGGSILAIFYKDGREYDRRGLPDQTIAYHPDDDDMRDHLRLGFQGKLPGDIIMERRDGGGFFSFPAKVFSGEIFRIEGYEGLAIVFNSKCTAI
jgi:hypothetical protein